ncbi:MAG TPA: 23S rRNA (guanosine(2251)-2'-O)-methyltransferase RlmB [bacterium]|nr:23S rRNA (guanosine(2251)-2'-O)-methyltransferase RlmB [bacterium]
MSELLYGKNPILETLRAGRRKAQKFFHLKSARPDPSLEEVLGLCRESQVKVSEVGRDWFEAKLSGVLAQGWALEASEFPYVELEGLFLKLSEKKQSIVLALDQIQDPQNLGAILRNAEAVAVDAVLICTDRAIEVTPAVVKASAGACEHLAISKVVNLARAMEQLKERGFWAVGTSLETEENGLSFDWPEKTLLVLGSEGKGMRRLIHEKCDFLIKLPLLGRISSLNVASTAAVCMYEIVRKQRFKA